MSREPLRHLGTAFAVLSALGMGCSASQVWGRSTWAQYQFEFRMPAGYEMDPCSGHSCVVTLKRPPDSYGGRDMYPNLSISPSLYVWTSVSSEVARDHERTPSPFNFGPRTRKVGSIDAVEFASVGTAFFDFVDGGASTLEIVYHTFLFHVDEYVYQCTLEATAANYRSRRKDVETFCASVIIAKRTRYE